MIVIVIVMALERKVFQHVGDAKIRWMPREICEPEISTTHSWKYGWDPRELLHISFFIFSLSLSLLFN
jgi:hypothetical protein